LKKIAAKDKLLNETILVMQ